MFRARSVLLAAMLAVAAPFSDAEISPACLRTAEWGSRGATRDLVVDGNVLWIADGRGLSAYDVTGRPRPLGRSSTSTPSREVALLDQFVATLTASGLEVFTRDPLAPEPVAAPVAASGLVHLAASENRIVTAGTDLSLWAVEGSSIRKLHSAPFGGAASNGLAVHGGHVYLGVDGGSLSVFSIESDRLKLVKTLPIRAGAIAFERDLLFAAFGPSLEIFRLTSPTTTQKIGTLFDGESDFRDLAAANGLLFAADRGQRLTVIDARDPAMPKKISGVPRAAVTVAADERNVFVGTVLNDNGGLTAESGVAFATYDSSDPAALKLRGEASDFAGPVAGVATDGSFAYVADPPMFRVLDIRNRYAPRQVASLQLTDNADRVRIRGGVALAFGRGDVAMIDISNPYAPRFLGRYHSGGLPRSAATFAGPYVIEANRATGLHVLDVSNPMSPLQINGRINDDYGAFSGHVVALERSAYASAFTGVKVIDLTQFSRNHKQLVIRAVVGDLELIETPGVDPLLVVLDFDRLRIFTLREPLAPVEIGSATVTPGGDLTMNGQIGYYVAPDGMVSRVDLTTPASPRTALIASGVRAPQQIAAASGAIVVADTYGLQILVDPAEVSIAVIPNLTAQVAPNGRTVRLQWSGGGEYELQSDDDASFSSPETRVVSRGVIDLAANGDRFFRVRQLSGCSGGAWSNVVQLNAVKPLAGFGDSGRHLVAMRGTAALEIGVPLVNDAAAAATLTLTAPAALQIMSTEVTLGSGEQRSIPVRIQTGDLPAGRHNFNLAARSGEATSSYAVVVDLVEPSQSERTVTGARVLPGIGSLRGAAGTTWRSDVSLFCDSAESCAATVRYLPTAGSPVEANISLASDEVLTINDVASTLFGRQESSGVVGVTGPAVRANAVTYNDSPNGRFGQRITAYRASDFSNVAHPRLLSGIEETTAIRTNVGFVNTGATTEIVRMTLRGTDGLTIAVRELEVAPASSGQLPLLQLFALAPRDVSGVIDVYASPLVAVYGSRIDRRTGDAVFAYAERYDDTVRIANTPRERLMPAAGSVAGANESQWRTALRLTSAAPVPQTLELAFQSAIDGSVATQRVELSPLATLSSDDVMSDLFASVSPAARVAGSIRVASSQSTIGWGRIFNTSARGTYGQYVPISDVSLSASSSGTTDPRRKTLDRERFPQLFPLSHDAESRTNVGLVETSGRDAVVALRTYDGSGVLLDVSTIPLVPFASRLLNGYLLSRRLTGMTNLRIEIEVEGEGSVTAYGSIVNAGSGDAIFIAAE